MPGVMQQNRLELHVEINHPWRQGREEEVFCSRASLHLTKPKEPQAGSESRGRIRLSRGLGSPGAEPVLGGHSDAPALQGAGFPSLPSSLGFTLWQAMHRAARSDKMAVPQIYGVYL